MAGLGDDVSLSISDDTLANIPMNSLSTTSDISSEDLFDSTLTQTMTSTQHDTTTDDQPDALMADPSTKSTTTSTCQLSKAKVCVTACKPRVRKSDLVQCHLCQHWYHPHCVGEKNSDIVGVWSCPLCRLFPDNIQSMMNILASILDDNQGPLTRR